MTDVKTPAQIAFDYYGEDAFYYILDLHFLHGYVYSTPDYFAMGRPVDKEVVRDDLIDPRVTSPKERQNCWFIYYVSGNMVKAFDNLPFFLPYCLFERKGILKFYKLEKLKHRISKSYGIRT